MAQKKIICLCTVIVSCFCLAEAVQADELSELKEQWKVTQKQMQEQARQMEAMQEKIKQLEAESQARIETPNEMKERVIALEEKIAKKDSLNVSWKDGLSFTSDDEQSNNGHIELYRTLHKNTSEEDQLYTVLQDIERETKRCAEIVRNLLTFSHTEQDNDKAYQKESLAEILGRVLKLLSYRIEKQGISVTQHIADDTPEIWMKPNNIQQLILNLATNAFDALEESERKEFNVDIHREGQFVRMTTSDTGCGIAAESLRSIFDPFFTTKPVGQGTGLGLSVSQGIIKAHGGQISCESKPGAGTKFIILLPIERSKENEQANTYNRR